MDKPLPLSGIRVLDFTHIVAGPQCTRILGDMGAQVIKVETEQALDSLRMSPIGIGGEAGPNRSGLFEYFNRNKLSVTINALHPSGLAIIKKLLAVSDIVIENFSSKVLERWGLSYDEQVAIKPDIIYASITGFGHNGRDREYSTWGPTAQALSGLTLMSGLPGERPAGWGYSFLDHTAGYNAAIAVLMALHHRNNTGEGQWVDLSQIETGMVLTGPQILDYTVNNNPYRRQGLPAGNHATHPKVAPHNTYQCKGIDKWCVITVPDNQHWGKFQNALSSESWVHNEKFQSNEQRIKHEAELDTLIEQWTINKTPHEVMHWLQSFGVAAGAVQTNADKVERDPQLRARDFFVKFLHRETEEYYETDQFPSKFTVTDSSVRQGSPPIGADTLEVLQTVLDLSTEEITSLYEEAAL